MRHWMSEARQEVVANARGEARGSSHIDRVGAERSSVRVWLANLYLLFLVRWGRIIYPLGPYRIIMGMMLPLNPSL